MDVDSMIQKLRNRFDLVKDHRASNCKYRLSDVLMAGFAIFHQKDPSLLAFREQFPARSENMKRVYGLEKIPEDTGFRECLDQVSPDLLQGGFSELFSMADQSGILAQKRVLGGRLALSFDGTGHFSSNEISCPHCLVKHHRDGKVSYHHQALAAVVTCPGSTTVLPIFAEPIVNADGHNKNDCERNAFKRLLPKVRTMLPEKEAIVAVADALYADGPTVRALGSWDMDFIIVIKEGYVLVQAQAMAAKKQLQETSWTDAKTSTTARWATGLTLNGANQDLLVNYLEIKETDLKTGKITYENKWITNLDLNKDTVREVASVGRSRWQIENETFNTLKNQGYHLEHSYGHGKKFLSSVFALLMLLAFAVDQLAQAVDSTFKKAMAKFKTRKGFWKRVSAVFDIVPTKSMNAIYRFIAGEIQINLPQIE